MTDYPMESWSQYACQHVIYLHSKIMLIIHFGKNAHIKLGNDFIVKENNWDSHTISGFKVTADLMGYFGVLEFWEQTMSILTK